MAKSKRSVLFNASVVLAGLKSPTGGSARLLDFVKTNKIKGLISEVIFDEVLRNASRIGFNGEQLSKRIRSIFPTIEKEPAKASIDKFTSLVIDLGDTHVLASTYESNSDFLVTLDKKHLLILQDQVKDFKIVTPGQLIEMLRGKKSVILDKDI